MPGKGHHPTALNVTWGGTLVARAWQRPQVGPPMYWGARVCEDPGGWAQGAWVGRRPHAPALSLWGGGGRKHWGPGSPRRPPARAPGQKTPTRDQFPLARGAAENVRLQEATCYISPVSSGRASPRVSLSRNHLAAAKRTQESTHPGSPRQAPAQPAPRPTQCSHVPPPPAGSSSGAPSAEVRKSGRKASRSESK